jgi:predicted  nucleic acid-binding Zn-ribbon protein
MKTSQKFTIIPSMLIIIFVLISYSAVSQKVIEVKNTTAQMSKGNNPCYVVQIPQAVLKTVQQSWIKKLQEGNKTKVKELNQELQFIGAVKPEITPDSISIYSILIQADSMVTINVFVEIDTVFFGPSEDKALLANDKIDNNIRNYIRDFAITQYKIAVEDELETEQKTLKTMQNDLEKMEKDEENMKKDISTLDNDIDETEKEIKMTEKNLDLKNQEIATHGLSMEKLSTDTEKKAASDKKKQLEKEKKDIEKDISKLKDNVSSDKSKIDKNEKAIKDSEEAQAKMQEEIVNQTTVVEKVQTKLNGIK